MSQRTKQVMGIIFMFVFFFLGGITRAIYLSNNVEWLRGVPQFMAAFSFLSPLAFSWKIWLNRKSFQDGFYWKVPFLFVYLLLVASLFFFGVTAY